jgi:hypothetical protein
MMRELVIRDVVDGLYILTPPGTNAGPPCTVPTAYFGESLMPVGTLARITFATLPDPEIIRANGRYCGYPECCIENCVTRPGRLSNEQREASQGTGFAPCPACARLVLAGKPLHELLLPTRRAKPFTYPRARPPV